MNAQPLPIRSDLCYNLERSDRCRRRLVLQANVLAGDWVRIIPHNDLIRNVFMHRQTPGTMLKAPASQLNSSKRSGGSLLRKPTHRYATESLHPHPDVWSTQRRPRC